MTARPPTSPQLGDVVTRAGIVAWSVLGILVVLWAGLIILGRMRVLLAPIVLAIVIIYVLNPLVTRLKARGVPRLVGTFLAFSVLIGGLVLVGFLVAPSISEQAGALGTDFPTIYDDASAQIEQLADSAGFTVNLWTYVEVEEFINDPDNQDQFLSAAWERIGAVTSGLLEAILVFFLAPVIAFYLLIDLPRVRDEAVALIPERHRDEVRYVAGQLATAVGGFLRGQVLVAAIVGVMMSFGFWLIDLQFWLIIGMVAGFLNIIPFVGPWVGGFLGVGVGLLTGSVSTAFWAGIVAIVVQQVDNNFVSPTVLRATVRIHPAVVIMVLILGGAVGGLWGVLLAVPATASAKIIGGHLWRTRVLGQSWEEATAALLVAPRPPEPLRRFRREAPTAGTGVAAGAGSPAADVGGARPTSPGSSTSPGSPVPGPIGAPPASAVGERKATTEGITPDDAGAEQPPGADREDGEPGDDPPGSA